MNLQDQLGITFVLVTHDQEEALSMSDRVVVMRAGHVEQIGTPRDVYENPCNLFVARFVGEINVFDAEVKGLIHDFTGGIPRQINNLATACLLGAAGSGVLRIDKTLFQSTVSEFQLS
mgnify:CR=1 FL=1